ncbi:MAG: hypothetical protein H0U98_17825 [Alphaproteobacteria bacterium]|nr:hypothetical protein [Alphaproteobacteria bacterium]
MVKTLAEKYAASLNRELSNLPCGSLRFWGVSFGRPYDNRHEIVGAEGESNLLRIRFNEGELLSVWSPSGLKASASVFQIADAERVCWEWYYYGRPQAPENLCFENYVKGQPGTFTDALAVEMLSLNLSKSKGFALLLQIVAFFRAYLAQKRS